MKKYVLLLLLVLTATATVFGLAHKAANPTTIASTSTTATQISNVVTAKQTKHVIVIIMENYGKAAVIGNISAPYMNSVLLPNYSIEGEYYAITHPSLPNYIAITSGGTLGVNSDFYPVHSLNDKNLVDLLSENNITWKAYMESMPNSKSPSCLNGLADSGGTYGYVHRHDPFVYYTDIVNNSTRCNSVVPLTQFYTDMKDGKLPDFSFITPNVLDDGHDAPPSMATCPPSGTSLQCVDNWLSGFLNPVIGNAMFSNTVIFLTWDEAATSDTSGIGGSGGGNILLVAVSPYSKKGFVANTTAYSHYSLLATIEKIYNIGNLGRNDSTANSMNDLFMNNTLPDTQR